MTRGKMMMISLVVAGLAAGLAAGGCAAFLSSPSAGSKVRVMVPKAPPAAKAENKPAAARPGHFWVRGYWDWVPRASIFQWRPGQFKKVRPNRRYVRARYTRKDGQWIYRIPHWRRAKARRAQPSPRTTPKPSSSAGGGPVTSTQ